MKKIEDYQLQMYVDNELSQSEMKKVQEFIDTNSEAKSKVDNYKKINNLVIETPSSCRSRYFETRAYHNIMLDAIRDGVEWISAPKPILKDESFQEYSPIIYMNEKLASFPKVTLIALVF